MEPDKTVNRSASSVLDAFTTFAVGVNVPPCHKIVVLSFTLFTPLKIGTSTNVVTGAETS